MEGDQNYRSYDVRTQALEECCKILSILKDRGDISPQSETLFYEAVSSVTCRVRILSLHLHEIVEGLYFHCSLSVCVCVCPALLVNKFQPNGCTNLNAVFAKMVAYTTGSNPIEIDDRPWVKGQGHIDSISIFSS